jgi:predicted GNAT family N-acyltransferase
MTDAAMNFHVTVGDWDAQQAGAQAVRYEVFIVEQNIPVELEWDDMDKVCLHAVVHDKNDAAIGTGRLLPNGYIGRMAVRKSMRRTGIGGAILAALMQQSKKRGDKAVMLNAQLHAVPFYTRHGFVPEGEEFPDAGIPHIRMRHVFR